MPLTKRSQIVILTIMGVGAASLMIEGGEAEPEMPARLFETVDICVAESGYGAADCAGIFARAARDNVDAAPRYLAQSDCEAEFSAGGCEAVARTAGPGDAPLFAPVMAGVLVAAAAGGLRGDAAALPPVRPVYRNCSVDAADPCPRNPVSGSGGGSGGGVVSGAGRAFYTADGERVAVNGTRTLVRASAFSGSGMSRPTLARGGFGLRAAGMRAGG